MGYPLQIAYRYLGSRNRGAFISLGTVLAILGVTLGVAALLTVMSVTGGFQAQFREKVLGVNAHVLVLKYSSDFREYRDVMKKMQDVKGVVGVAPFTINPMMVTRGDKTATGVLLKGVDPALLPTVLDLPRHIVAGSLEGLRLPDAKPPTRPIDSTSPYPLQPLPFPGDSLGRDAGASLQPEHDDAGRNLTLLRAVEAEIKDLEARADAGADAGAGDAGQGKKAAVAVDGGVDAEVPLPKGALSGSVEPKGGYESQLPDSNDELPEDVAPDPCSSPDQVAKLPGMVMGRTLAKNLGAEIGSCVQVTSPTIGFSYSGGAVRPPMAKQFRVTAIFEAGFDQYDSKLVYCDLYEAQAFYDQGDSVTGVEMKVADIDEAAAISAGIHKKLTSNLYHTMDWEELNHGLFTALRIQKIMMSFVLALIIVVAAFTVIATLIMVVLEKKKEIAVLKAMGATDGAVLNIFLYQGSLIGGAGTAFGLLLGWGVCKGLLVYGFPLDPKVYFISRLPVETRLSDFIITGCVALGICLLATVLPALYAARLRPADGVRAE
ncbi:MAG: ABC transporter permease [Deltaproteobacteria bacterium]|nr:ABC transporter permease [Deltaproteobacteria bacterium]